MQFLIAQLFPSSCHILVNPNVLFNQNEKLHNRLGAAAISCCPRFPWFVPGVNLNNEDLLDYEGFNLR